MMVYSGEKRSNGTETFDERDDLSLSDSSSVTLPFSVGDESTPTNSLPSSGRSTPSFRKRPKRPDIKITEHKDYLEIRRFDSMSSIASDCDSLSNESIDIPDEVIAKAIFSTEANSHPINTVHEFEETLRDDTPIPKNTTEAQPGKENILLIEKICEARPESPTSKFLSPIISNNTQDIVNEILIKLSPMLHKLNELEEQNKKLSSMQVKLAVLQEEKRQLTTMLKHKRHENDDNFSLTSSSNESVQSNSQNNYLKIVNNKHVNSNNVFDKTFKEKGVQKYLELVTEISHMGTSTDDIIMINKGTGEAPAELKFFDKLNQTNILQRDFSDQALPEQYDIGTETIPKKYKDQGLGENIAEKFYSSASCQSIHNSSDSETQTNLLTNDKQTMHGSSLHEITDSAIGDDMAEIITNNTSCQTPHTINSNQETQCDTVGTKNKTTSIGCSVNALKSTASQFLVDVSDFSCGDNKVEVLTDNSSTQCAPQTLDNFTETYKVATSDASTSAIVSCKSIGIGESDVNKVICDICENKKVRDFACGTYVNLDPCCIDDKLCDCVKPILNTRGVGIDTIDDILCERCNNLKTTSIGVGDHKLTDLLCDRCTNMAVANIGIGDDRIDDIMCEKCSKLSELVEKGVGEFDVNTECEKCLNKNDTFNFDLNIKPKQLQAVLCHYCGNKVDLEDESLDANLQAMRESMKNISSGMKRANIAANLSLDIDRELYNITPNRNSRRGSLESPGDSNAPSLSARMEPIGDVAEEEARYPISDDEDDIQESGRNDVIEACKMLHNHFSGAKTLNKANMVKYMGIIQVLWFKTVKRRRANASVVKSYLDLFQQRIPELLETIVNMTDDDGNTALHYALTYKNFSVVSILLDSGECAVNMINQAGYSPIMLAAIAGFERKNDKYIMQRLIRMGDVDKVSADAGQTPLMLAVSHGNVGVIEILLDAGCDINAVDDEGSTALMCSCEHGNINIVKTLLANPECDATIEDNEGSTALSIAMDSRRKDLALLIYGSLNFDARGRIKLSPSKQSLLGLGRRSPSPVIGRK